MSLDAIGRIVLNVLCTRSRQRGRQTERKREKEEDGEKGKHALSKRKQKKGIFLMTGDGCK